LLPLGQVLADQHQVWGKKAPAVIAIAHSLLILTYQVLSTGQAYQEKSARS
jgi:hypothetical protein